MTLPVVWLPDAADELRNAVAWYADISADLGTRFAGAVIETVDEIAHRPAQFAVVSKGRRRAGVRRFPYGLFFVIEDTRVVVIACFHPKRHPRYWQGRGSL